MVHLKSILPRAAFVLASAASVANAQNQIKITAPSKDIWWVAKSTNVLTWDCNNSPVDSFTISISNPDPKLLPDIMPFISVQQNSQCSILVSQDQANQPAGTGYVITFSNILNLTDVVGTSDPFEIKPLGSLYPSQVTPTANASSSASPTGGSDTSKPSSAATAVGSRGIAGIFGGLALGAVGMMF
ncbi:hypothetical protein JR316_0009795 [Psilocybe cubensis]|uniref:Uncharacterized protein n=2 Tax=Psilocybe cubensis TaxID=181762 RepID=A0A8H7XMI3_PSICU|nr:hypothetical protein JR316_0009795 [Psilocybe cubensis]KAH9477573.1 hypothetical protein JR316_0009795 [Psilocybe cubensis]